MADFPAAVTSLTNPTSTDKMNSPAHATQHANANDEIEAIETELGTDPAGSHTNVVGRLDAMDAKTGALTFWSTLAAGSSTTIWWTAPYACNISGRVVYAVSSGTGRTVSVAHGSAGDNALATATAGVSGTVGAVVAMVASASASATAWETMRIVTTTCATAQTYGITLLLARTGTA